MSQHYLCIHLKRVTTTLFYKAIELTIYRQLFTLRNIIAMHCGAFLFRLNLFDISTDLQMALTH